MQYATTLPARFLERPNRFIARVRLPDGTVETVHVKNTGRCRELLLPEVEVMLCEGTNPARKTRYDLVAVKKESIGWINMDSQAPNTVMKEWLLSQDYDTVKPEQAFGNSRIDFLLTKGDRKTLVEVKGCTLEIDGKGFFPDAPTERGAKHLNELAEAKRQGYDCAIAFVIQMNGIERVSPNTATDPGFASAYEEAKNAGVEIWHMTCQVTETGFTITGRTIERNDA